MEQWVIDLTAEIEAALAADRLDPADVGYTRKRRMAYEKRWPTGRQMEAHADAALGDTAKRDLMLSEIAAIKEAIPKPVA